VALSLALVGAITITRAICCAIVQVLAGICAAAVVNWIISGPSSVGTTLGPNTSITQGLFLEMFLTAQLVLAVLLLAVEKHRATFLAPVGIGFSLFIGHITGVYFTGAGLNPARSFGPQVLEGFPGYAWIYWLGPALGAILASALYKLLRLFEYHLVLPSQDSDGLGKAEAGLLSSSLTPAAITQDCGSPQAYQVSSVVSDSTIHSPLANARRKSQGTNDG
jgi:aquaporin rerated protein, other eukaryote